MSEGHLHGNCSFYLRNRKKLQSDHALLGEKCSSQIDDKDFITEAIAKLVSIYHIIFCNIYTNGRH